MFFSREETQGWKRWCIPDAINGCPHLALAGLLDVSCMKEIWSAIIPCQEGWEDRQTFFVYLARPNAGLKPNSFVSRTNRAQITNYSLLMWRYMSWAKAWHVAERSGALVSFWARGGRCRGWGAPSRLGRWCQTWRWFRGSHHHDKFDLIPFAPLMILFDWFRLSYVEQFPNKLVEYCLCKERSPFHRLVTALMHTEFWKNVDSVIIFVGINFSDRKGMNLR